MAVLLDIDTEGEDPLGGLPILSQLRRLQDNITLISLSRDRRRSVEKQALAAGADAHFRNPVGVAELRATVLEFLRRRTEKAERERMRQQVLGASRFQDFVGASEPMRPCRQGQPRSYSSHADLGKGCRRQVADSCTGDYWTSLQSRQSSRNSVGNRHFRKRRLVCGSRVCSTYGTGSPRTS